MNDIYTYIGRHIYIYISYFFWGAFIINLHCPLMDRGERIQTVNCWPLEPLVPCQNYQHQTPRCFPKLYKCIVFFVGDTGIYIYIHYICIYIIYVIYTLYIYIIYIYILCVCVCDCLRFTVPVDVCRSKKVVSACIFHLSNGPGPKTKSQ